ncbi:MAG: hypothetical protein QM736_27265 [Vicinamibacterales bacterium]
MSTSGCATLFAAKDKAGDLLRDTLAPLLVYTAEVAPSIAYSIDERRSRDAVGLRLGARAVRAVGCHRHQRGARRRTPRGCPATRGRPARRRTQPLPSACRRQRVCNCSRTSKERSGVIKRNPGGSLVDLGDGVLCVELHSKMNAIGADTVQMHRSPE